MNLKSDQRDLAIKTQFKKTQYHALKNYEIYGMDKSKILLYKDLISRPRLRQLFLEMQ